VEDDQQYATHITRAVLAVVTSIRTNQPLTTNR
jgi:hypothetical protein